MAKKKVEEVVEAVEVHTDTPEMTLKEKMQDLYQTMKDYGINSISDVENKIARL